MIDSFNAYLSSLLSLEPKSFNSFFSPCQFHFLSLKVTKVHSLILEDGRTEGDSGGQTA